MQRCIGWEWECVSGISWFDFMPSRSTTHPFFPPLLPFFFFSSPTIGKAQRQQDLD